MVNFNCPNCGQKMKYIDEDYFEKHYKCDKCNIIRYSDEYYDIWKAGTWVVPSYLEPTEKQRKCAAWISRVLHIEFEASTKESYWNFINEHIEEAKKAEEVKKVKYIPRYNKHSYSKSYFIDDEDCYLAGLDASMFY